MATQKSGRLAGRHGSDMYALMDEVVVRELLGQQVPVTSRPAGGGWVSVGLATTRTDYRSMRWRLTQLYDVNGGSNCDVC